MAIGYLLDSKNLARKGVAWAGNTGTADGTSPAALNDGMVGPRWRSKTAATNHGAWIQWGSRQPISFVSVHDIRVHGPGQLSQVTIEYLNFQGLRTVIEARNIDGLLERGSLFFRFTEVNTDRISVFLQLTNNATVSIGEITAGDLSNISDHFASVKATESFPSVVNGEYAVKLAPPQLTLEMQWPPNKKDVLGPLVQATEGNLTPVVLVPDYNSPVVYHGRIETPREYSYGVNKVYEFSTLKFVESRRSLG